MRFARAGDSANRWHGVTRWRSQVDADTEPGRGFRATEGPAEVDAQAIIEGFRIADRKRRTPILEAHARSQANLAARAGASPGHLHRGPGHSPLDRKSVVTGKSVSVRVDLGGCRILKQTKNNINRA